MIAHKTIKTFFFITVVLCIISCSPNKNEQAILAQADSLNIKNIDYNDSTQLSHAVATFEKQKYFHKTEYAKANYYYGKLLLQHGNPVQAMQCFINATKLKNTHSSHNPTTDTQRLKKTQTYQLLGKTYSEIGSICHIAENHNLALDQYQIAAEQFKSAQKHHAYMISLCNIAHETAEQNNKKETLSLLNTIESDTDSCVIKTSYFVKSKLYYNLHQYDSAIYFATFCNEPQVMAVKAMAEFRLNHLDSALLHAKEVVEMQNATAKDKYDMLYLLINANPALDTIQIKKLTQQRIALYLDTLQPLNAQYFNATQLVETNVEHHHDYNWIITTIYIILTVILLSGYILTRTQMWKRKQEEKVRKEQQQTQQFVQEQENQLKQTTEQEINRQQELQSDISLLEKQNETLRQEYDAQRQLKIQTIEHSCHAIRSAKNLKTELQWDNYELFCQTTNRCFNFLTSKLQQHCNLSEQEIRLCITVLLEFNQEQISELLNYSQTGVGKFKYRVAKKLGTSSLNLRTFLIEKAIE